MLVMDIPEYDLQVLCDDANPGYAWLRTNRGEKPRELNKVLAYWNFLDFICCCFRLYVDPGKTVDMFIKELQNVIKNSKMMKGKVKFRRNGPVIQMDVHPDSGWIFWGPRLYSVELVPAYHIGGALYVSKPLEEEIPNAMTWGQEKENQPNGAKFVLRALMVIRNREPALESLTLYHLKTVLFYEMDQGEDWSDYDQRLLGVLRLLEVSLDFGNLPHYFYRETNLLSSMSPPSLRNMRDIIKCIRSSAYELRENAFLI